MIFLILIESERLWLILSILFCFLALDERYSVHEQLAFPIRSALATSGIFYFAWTIPYGLAVLLLSLYVIPVIWKLEYRIRSLFIMSAAIFLTGSIGLEMLGGWYLERADNNRDMIYILIATVEESLEMAGLVVLVYAILSLLQAEYGGFSIHICMDCRETAPNKNPLTHDR